MEYRHGDLPSFGCLQPELIPRVPLYVHNGSQIAAISSGLMIRGLDKVPVWLYRSFRSKNACVHRTERFKWR